ncbi:Asp-tRNA(Asn)/Glu-tRNA(Gln) amidotransferase subunit GatA [Candidatus Shapirobacteria bacterium]|nr:Asp-tRNA(Asn)/Glu-tRNA(Gln) amidotransferase subunit GatA [Candidatus Shapirobacteria bacterium]
MKLNELTIKEAHEGLRQKKFSSLELVRACLGQIKRLDPKINAFITVCEREAAKEAERADKILGQKPTDISARPLLGIPVAVKDNFCTKGLKTTASSNVLADFIPPYDATVVTKIKDAGAVILGKTNMDAWAHGSSTETSDFFTTHNPWNFNRLPGGSSGGSAASIAADETIASLGSETAGSIRQPSSWCGTVGFKPTYGRVSRYGLIAMASSLDCPGPIAKTVSDAAILLRIIAGKDPSDATTSSYAVPNYLEKINKGTKGIRVGVAKEYLAVAENEIKEAVLAAVKTLEKMGAKVKDISLVDPKYAIAVYTILQRSEVSSNLARYDGIRFGFGREKFGQEAKRRIMLGTYYLSAGYYEAYYLKAQKMRSIICRDFEKAFKDVDVILGPSAPTTALPLGASKDHPMFGEMMDILFEPSAIAGLPGLSLTCGFSAEGLPIGMQILGPQFSEELLFQVGYAFEQATDWHKRKPKL